MAMPGEDESGRNLPADCRGPAGPQPTGDPGGPGDLHEPPPTPPPRPGYTGSTVPPTETPRPPPGKGEPPPEAGPRPDAGTIEGAEYDLNHPSGAPGAGSGAFWRSAADGGRWYFNHSTAQWEYEAPGTHDWQWVRDPSGGWERQYPGGPSGTTGGPGPGPGVPPEVKESLFGKAIPTVLGTAIVGVMVYIFLPYISRRKTSAAPT
jgi:hypothetical protein